MSSPRQLIAKSLGDNHHAAHDGEDMAPTKRVHNARDITYQTTQHSGCSKGVG